MSTTQVTVLEIVAVLLHASVAVNVLVCEKPHELGITAPSIELIVIVPQPSVAVAVPSKAEGFAGLHPRTTSE